MNRGYDELLTFGEFSDFLCPLLSITVTYLLKIDLSVCLTDV